MLQSNTTLIISASIVNSLGIIETRAKIVYRRLYTPVIITRVCSVMPKKCSISYPFLQQVWNGHRFPYAFQPFRKRVIIPCSFINNVFKFTLAIFVASYSFAMSEQTLGLSFDFC